MEKKTVDGFQSNAQKWFTMIFLSERLQIAVPCGMVTRGVASEDDALGVERLSLMTDDVRPLDPDSWDGRGPAKAWPLDLDSWDARSPAATASSVTATPAASQFTCVIKNYRCILIHGWLETSTSKTKSRLRLYGGGSRGAIPLRILTGLYPNFSHAAMQGGSRNTQITEKLCK